MPFTTLGLGAKITTALTEQGYVEPTPIQAKAIPVILEGRDIIGVAQTGTGKTAAFVLPLLERLSASPSQKHMRALVVAPTRELVAQIEENIRAYGRHLPLRYATIFGGVGGGPQIQALRRGVDIAVATPGRLLDLMQQRHVSFADLQVLVLDEADRMLDMGFLPPIRKIVAATPKMRQTLLFSATLSKEIEAVSKEFLKTPVLVEIGARSTPVEAVAQWIVEVSQAAKVPALVHLLKDSTLQSVLVFSRTKHGADRIARKLEDAGIRCATLHSNRTQGQRILALKRFKSGDVRCLVATDIAARGIDVDGISHVINYDFPMSCPTWSTMTSPISAKTTCTALAAPDGRKPLATPSALSHMTRWMTCAGSSAFSVAVLRGASSKGLSPTRHTPRPLPIAHRARDIDRRAQGDRTRALVVIVLVVERRADRGARVDPGASAAGPAGDVGSRKASTPDCSEAPQGAMRRAPPATKPRPRLV